MKIREIVSKIQAQEPLSRELLKEIHAILESKADDAYKLLSAMSLATCAPFDEKTRTLTASLLQCHADPILAGRALKVLIVAWGGYANYRSELINGIFGENWDNGHYRLAAIQSSGAYLRRILDKEILSAILKCLLDPDELEGTREASRDAILKAMGKNMREIVNDSIKIDLAYNADDDEPVIWARGIICS